MRHKKPTRIRTAEVACGVALATLGVPALHAQQFNPWRLEPSIGVLIDDYDTGLDGNRAGVHAALQVSRTLAPAVRGLVTVGLARVNDVSAYPPASRYTERNDWIFVTAGPQADVLRRRVDVALGLQIGVAWRRLATTSGALPPTEAMPSRDWSPTAVIAPSVQVRRSIGANLAITGGATAYLLNPPESVRVSPAFTLGMSFQP